jgi:hypothetical protein
MSSIYTNVVSKYLQVIGVGQFMPAEFQKANTGQGPQDMQQNSEMIFPFLRREKHVLLVLAIVHKEDGD